MQTILYVKYNGRKEFITPDKYNKLVEGKIDVEVLDRGDYP